MSNKSKSINGIRTCRMEDQGPLSFRFKFCNKNSILLREERKTVFPESGMFFYSVHTG